MCVRVCVCVRARVCGGQEVHKGWLVNGYHNSCPAPYPLCDLYAGRRQLWGEVGFVGQFRG